MSLMHRIKRLEGPCRGTCAECGGKGRLVVSYHTDGEPAPVAVGCSSCGEAYHVIIDFRDETLPGRPVVNSCENMTGAEIGALYE